MQNLKDQNKLSLAALTGMPLLIIFVLEVGISETKSVIDYVTGVGFVALAVTLLVLLSDVIPQSLKNKIVFLRLWNELPGHRCDRLCFADPRLEKNELQTTWEHVFGGEICESERNALWYRHIYKPVMDEPQVQSAHLKFLLYRDVTASSFVILSILIVWSVSGVQLPYLGTIHPWAIVIEATFLLCTLICAQTYGKRLVVNATAIRTAT
ncbi:hypothetical protein [Photobacterium iliopiscarium]|jgi:hypothetical protein|uniref:Uncharacterized protein n=1 Tax=Photobacterium iliopiscarium TaxID=56192 RepID=A0A2T3MJD3_9GAMM|nr:hypothetical protein [Photobacterium iliopiscarium]PSV95631.1 hypothetical protein C9I88_13310 [Photobacterium iliopiscarium]